MIVVTADQRDSSRAQAPDLVPAAERELAAVSSVDGQPQAALSFTRTVGDEVQGVLNATEPAVAAVLWLLRDGRWRVGVGLGDVEHPLPTRAPDARGSAFVAARAALDSLGSGSASVAVRAAVGEADYGAAQDLEDSLRLMEFLFARRSDQGREVAELLIDRGRTGREAAADLSISAAAVSQRAARAGVEAERRGRRLATRLLTAAHQPWRKG